MKRIRIIIISFFGAALLTFTIWWFQPILHKWYAIPGIAAIYFCAFILHVCFFFSFGRAVALANSREEYFRFMRWTPKQIKEYLENLEDAESDDYKPASKREALFHAYLRLRGR